MTNRIGDIRQMPAGVNRYWDEHNHDSMLPIEAGSRFKLVSFEHGGGVPYALYDNHGVLLYEWDEGYTPSLEEVRYEVLKNL